MSSQAIQREQSTVSLNLRDWLFCGIIASSVLWLRELSKIVAGARNKKQPESQRIFPGSLKALKSWAAEGL